MKAKKYFLTLFILMFSSPKTFSQLPDWVPDVQMNCQNFTYTVPCRGGTGFIHPIITGGDPPFYFIWYDVYGNIISHEKDLDSVPSSWMPSINDYSIYILEIRKDSTVIGYTFDGILVEPDSFYMALNSYDTLGYNIYMHGGNNGHISSQVYGGTPPYVYSWSNGSQEADIAGLVAGNYTLTVTDANGCSIQKTESLREPAAALEITGMTGSLYHGYNISCFDGNDGSINVTVTGGVAPYSFDWYGNINSFNEDVTNLKSGTYTVIVTDRLGIKDTSSITLTQPPALNITLTPLVYPNDYNVSCYNCYNGKLTASLAGGVLPYTYHWSSGETTLVIDTLGHGEYEFFVTDVNGCTKTKNIILTTPERDDWSMNGNAGTNPNNQFMGTTDSTDFIFRTNNVERFRINSIGELSSPSFAGTDYDVIMSDANGTLLRVDPGGNPVYNPGPNPIACFPLNTCGNNLNINHWIGSRNNVDLIFKTFSQERMRITANGSIAIGQPSALPGSYKLFVTGGILTEKLRVADPNGTYWADFVFNKNYKLLSLTELKKFISTNKHLPGIPTSDEVNKNGIDIVEMNSKLLQKIEELTLYIIELNEKYDSLKSMKNN